MMTKQHNFLKITSIIFTCILFVSLHSSELPQRDYTSSTARVLSCDKHGSSTTETILLKLDKDNKIFGCYSHYRLIEWNYSYALGSCNPQIIKTTNILVEIDPHEKIKRAFDQLPELDNEYPVADIERSENLYLVAHQKSIYFYKKYHTFTKHALQKVKEYYYEDMPAEDHIKKIFLGKHDTLIAVSACGAIYQSNIKCPQGDITTTCDAFTQPNTIHSIAYNQAKNMIFFGLTGSVRIVALDSVAAAYTIDFAPKFTIRIIDTSNSHILFSDLIENRDMKADIVEKLNGHLKENGCCCENSSSDLCTTCLWKYQKNLRDQNIPIPAMYQLPGFLMKSCHHRNLPYSCLDTTIMVIAFNKLFSAMHTKKIMPIEDLHPQITKDRMDSYKGRSYSNEVREIPRHILTHALLHNNSLLIGLHSLDKCYWCPNCIFILPSSPINNLKSVYVDNDRSNPYRLYYSTDKENPHAESPYNDNEKNGDIDAPLRICKSEDEEKLCIVRLGHYERWYQRIDHGNVNFGLRQWIFDVILFTKTPRNERIGLKTWMNRIWTENPLTIKLFGTIGLAFSLYLLLKYR